MANFAVTTNMKTLDELFDYFENVIKSLKIIFVISNEDTKKQILTLAKQFREKFKKEWDKSKAKKFGELLKLLKTQRIFKKRWEKKTINSKHQLSDVLYNVKKLTDNKIKDYNKDALILKVTDEVDFEIDISKVKQIYNIDTRTFTRTFIITEKIIICKGNNTFGQLGLGNNQVCNIWVNFSSRNKEISDNLIKICLGYAYTYFITQIGVYSVGAGENGRLGINSIRDFNIPQKVHIQENVIDIACGSTHACLLTDKFELYTCGQQYYNGLSDLDILVPTKLELKDIISVDIGCGGYHTCCLTLDGTIKVWGHNRVGQLGISNKKIKENFPNKILLNLTDLKELVIVTRPIDIIFHKSIIKISVGWGHTFILTLDNELYVCGRNREKQLGINLENSDIKSYGTLEDKTIFVDRFIKIPFNNVTDIETNLNHSIVKADGKLWKLGTKHYANQVDINDLNIDNIILDKRIFNLSNYILIKK
jgi:alpha-tubulin suppressor-like RCC1 family protein